MAKTSSIYRNLKRIKMAEKYSNRYLKLKAIADDKSVSPEERFQAWCLPEVRLVPQCPQRHG